MLKLNHKNLEVWNHTLELVSIVYSLTSKFPDYEKFGLSNQLRRASVSVLSNIAEGASRSSALERRRFYEISRSSLVEVDAQIEIALKLKFLQVNLLDEFKKKINTVFALLSNLIKSTSK